MGFRSVCIESRCKCSYMGGYLVATGEEDTIKIHLSEISFLIFSTTQVYLSASLISELAKNKIPVVLCDEKSYPIAESLPLYGAHNCSLQLENQIQWSLPSKKRLWQRIVRDKILAQSEVLKLAEYNKQSEALITYAREVRSGDPTNREAAAANLYFPTLFGEGFNRDLNVKENAALNYGYSILLSLVSRDIVSRGYSTQLGIFHHGSTNQWNLACDLMEPFRPFVDSIVLFSGLKHFDSSFKHFLIDMVNKQLTYNDGSYKASSVINLYIKDCFDFLEKKIAVDDIKVYSLL